MDGMTRVERPTWRRSILVAVVLGVLVSAAAAQAPSTEAAESTDRLVFMRLSDAGTGADPRVGTIHTVGTDGSDLSDLGSGWSPVWSPDGHRIAFSDQLAGGSFEIFVMDADGSNRRRVTTSPVDDVMPTWSPDGRRIAFTRQEPGGSFNNAAVPARFSRLWIMNVDGSEQRPLTPASDGTFESHAAWSPDGRSIVFGRSRDGSSTIEIFDVDLETVSRVAEGYHPTWPAEGRVAYSVTDGDLNDQLYVVDLQGEDTTHLSDGDHASWSPDARTVAISRDPDGRAVDQTGPYGYAKAGPGNAAIYLLNPDGSDVRALTAPPPEATDQGPEFRPIGARAASTAGSRTGTGGGTGSASGTDAAPQAAGRLDGPPADQQNDDPDDARSRTRDAELSKVADRAPTVQGVGVAGDPDDLASADRGSPGGWAAAVIAGGLLGGLALVGVLGRRRLRQ